MIDKLKTDTPESDKAKIAFTSLFANDDAYWIPYAIGKKLERERDAAQKAMGDARDILLDAMPDANAPTKILAEMIVAERDILKKHISIMDISYKTANDEYFELAAENEKLERERDELCEWANVNGVSSLAKDRDQFRARLREEQQLHIQTLNERDEARGQLAGIENKMRGELGGHPDSELWGDAGLIAATMRCVDELDAVTEQRDRLVAVLQRIRDGYGGQAAAPDCCEDCEFLIPIDEALQSLNQPTEP